MLMGVLSKERKLLTVEMKSIKEFGRALITSPVMDFDYTDYYTKSMGSPLFRRFYLYPAGFAMSSLPDIKARTNAIEEEASATLDLGVKRPLNLDPGYLTLSKLVLASTKDFAHRIYLRDGLYAEITLHFRKGTYQAWPWTFPDYASAEYIGFFNRVRGELFGKNSSV